ncbi:MAG: PEP-CTERM sorting domain-containing protein [Chlorobia bacterium]|nr:PEP-CTERM sorting domain-containing protein [Fimbriimonadaceae bacterium]
MKYKFMVVGAIFASVVAAQAVEYRSDSGVSQNGVGLTAGGNFAWIQQFTVSGSDNMITSVSTTFGTLTQPTTSGVTPGQAFKVYVWKGTPTGAGVDAPTLLAQVTSNALAASIGTDVFQTVSINALITGTSNFFIGASTDHTSQTFPGPLQQTGTGPYPILDKSWVAGSSTLGAFDPNNLTGGIGILKNSAVGLSGNWLIRAQASPVPEPMSMAAIAMGIGALALRRRNKKA